MAAPSRRRRAARRSDGASASVPPCAATSSRAMARPRPVPSARPVTNGSNSVSRKSAATPGPLSATRDPHAAPSRARRSGEPCRRAAWRGSRSAGGWRARAGSWRHRSTRDRAARPSPDTSSRTPRGRRRILLIARRTHARKACDDRLGARTGSSPASSRAVRTSRRSSRAIWPRMLVQRLRRRASSPASAFSARSRIAAIGLRISCATPAATRPSAASRSDSAIRAASRGSLPLRRCQPLARRVQARPRCGPARALRSARSAAASPAACPASAASMRRTCRDHAATSQVSQTAIASTSTSSTPIPSRNAPIQARTRRAAKSRRRARGRVRAAGTPAITTVSDAASRRCSTSRSCSDASATAGAIAARSAGRPRPAESSPADPARSDQMPPRTPSIGESATASTALRSRRNAVSSCPARGRSNRHRNSGRRRARRRRRGPRPLRRGLARSRTSANTAAPSSPRPPPTRRAREPTPGTTGIGVIARRST